MIRLTITFILAISISACTTTDPYTGEEKVRKSVQFGAAGAVVCGLIGATRNSKSARNAAAGCAAIGAGVGAYMDHQEKELREELQGSGVRVAREGDQIQLIMPSNITFNTDEYLIKNEFYDTLDSVAKVLYKYKDTQLDVIGHTDSTGPNDHNMRLSQRRAQSVASYLEHRGILASRLAILGMGETQPIADNSTDSGREQNRRVELFVTATPE